MLGLSFIPCGDGGGGIIEIANHLLGIEHQHISDQDQHHKDCGNDVCTPFCICSCCSIALDIPKKRLSLFKYFQPILVNLSMSFSSFIPTSYYNSIWHPPQV